MSDRERLLSPLMELIGEGLDISEKENGKFNTFKFADHLIANGVTIEQPQWISCAERLPVRDGSYLICTDRGTVFTSHFYRAKTFLDGHTRKASWSKRGVTSVTHWMPLPQPPKEDE